MSGGRSLSLLRLQPRRGRSRRRAYPATLPQGLVVQRSIVAECPRDSNGSVVLYSTQTG
jgi:hypothetical protein